MKLLEHKDSIPLWFMRQAGRYHAHYQNLRSLHDFETLCKNPKLATQVTMGPIEDFDFDAAILFSDLLFPLEFIGLGLSYLNGPPSLSIKLDSLKKIQHLVPIGDGSADNFFEFQKQALLQIEENLKKSYPEVSLLGFVGSPWTLFAYAVEGGHSGGLVNTKLGLVDGRFRAFCDLMNPILIRNIQKQIDGKAECICIFDTAAGEIDINVFEKYILPELFSVIRSVKAVNPKIKIHYYAKFANLDYLKLIDPELVDIIGIDWRIDLSHALSTLGSNFYVQGNLDPSILFWPWEDLKAKVLNQYLDVKNNKFLDKWIFSLGHGVLPKTPVENVKKIVPLVKSLKKL